MHPDLETLVLCSDGELPAGRETQVRAHLAKCDSCRLEFHRLKHALAPLPAPDPAPFLLAGIRAKIRDWEAQRATDNWSKGLKVRVAQQIGPFLGTMGTDRVLEPVSRNGENLLCTIEPVLAEFLGNRAASKLVGRVVDSAL